MHYLSQIENFIELDFYGVRRKQQKDGKWNNRRGPGTGAGVKWRMRRDKVGGKRREGSSGERSRVSMCKKRATCKTSGERKEQSA